MRKVLDKVNAGVKLFERLNIVERLNVYWSGVLHLFRKELTNRLVERSARFKLGQRGLC